jgi:ABC-type dipeptide/oligopeptide/nickel transport system permease component
MRLVPGDPVMIMLQGEAPSAQDVELIRAQWGLNEPAVIQYVRYLSHLVTGDFGRSFLRQAPVLPVIVEYVPATIELAAVSLLIAMVLAVPMGILSAVKHRSAFDRLGMVVTVLGISMPGFWIGLLLVLVFSVILGWLPASGRLEFRVGLQPITGFYVLDSLLTGNADAFADALAHLIMPAFVLGTAMAAVTARMVRSSMLEVMRQEYVVSARAKGLRERAVIRTHMIRNAMLPVVTIIGIQAGTILGGAVVVETIFAWPGIGRLAVQAIGARDYFLLQGIVLFFALTRVFFNVLVDVLYGLLDPRIRFS